MRNPHSPARFHAALAMVAAVALMAGCDSAPRGDDARPADTPATEAPPSPVPDSTPAPSAAPPTDTPTAPAQPAPEPPPPTEPSPAPTPTSTGSDEPPLERMRLARAPSKLSVPVDLRYSFDSDPVANRAVTLHLAAVPRVTGTNLAVSIKPVEGLQVAAASPLAVQKANANGAYRQRMSITRQASVPELRVLVTMDLPEGLAHGFFSVPFEQSTKSQKQDSVKQR